MAVQKRYKAINFDLDTKKLKAEFGEKRYRQGYTQIQKFLTSSGFDHHQYSGYISNAAMSYGEIYILILDVMISKHPWLVACVNKFDATNVTSQSNMLSAIKDKTPQTVVDIESEFEGDQEIVL
jgi:virulence-associated protein VapD